MFDQCLSAGDVCQYVLQTQETRTEPAYLAWRAEVFRASEGQPMTLRRAAALNAVLARMDLLLQPGELLLGNSQGRMLPAGTADISQDNVAYVTSIGGRTFFTHADHAAPDYARLLQVGLRGLKEEAAVSLVRYTDPQQQAFLRSVLAALDGVSRYCQRWAAAAEQAAAAFPPWATLLTTQAAMLHRLAEETPGTLWEAVQLVYLLHTVFQSDERYAMALGRMDQYLYPFYQADLEAGRLTPVQAQTLVDHLLAKLAHRNDIQNICIGGVDADGQDAVNAVSYLILTAVQRIGRPGGNLTARISAQTPEAFLRKCAEVIRTGIGFPAVYNDDIAIPALVRLGYPLEEARDYCFVGCIEVYLPGRMAPWADSRFNLLRCVNLALWDGYDTVTGEQAGPHTGELDCWDAFSAAFLAQMRAGVQAHVEALNAIKADAEAQADALTSPLLSALMADSLARGRDLCDGGARYPANHGVAGMGIGVTADALMAIKRCVYDQPCWTLAELRQMLAANFAGYEEARRRLLHGAPKYGNDDPEVDGIATAVARAFGRECLAYRTPRGGYYLGLLAANVQNVSSGREVGASADGRLAFQPLSDAASPTFGRDIHGPTAVIRSIAKLDYHDFPAGNVINMKFHPTALAGEEGLAGLAALIRTCFTLGGIQLQFNTTNRDTLQQAMAHPEEYRNLVVRVSGFSAYFTTLERAVQEDVLARTEHALA